MSRPRARSGPSLPESARIDKLLSIRLTPRLRGELDALAAETGSRPSAIDAALALHRAMTEALAVGPVTMTTLADGRVEATVGALDGRGESATEARQARDLSQGPRS